ncbi:MAG: GDSL-type esterase/lipase family protein [Bacteroidia bacterium]|nr:GDSL-type esterase/lipase family protein [Bacteroidia bacterium]
MTRLKNILLLTVLLLSIQNSIGQPITIAETAKFYPFVKEEVNVISNSGHLAGLMEKLYDLKRNGNRTINILHIGDSHLQADFITSVIRTTLQKRFGNGGRGLVVPYHVAKTNEPLNYRSGSSYVWQSKRCVFPDQPLPIGIGGVTINSSDSCADIVITTINDSILDYSFNKVKLFFENDSTSYSFALLDSLGNRVSMFVPDSVDNYSFISTAAFPYQTNNMTVKVVKTGEKQSGATIYGLLLENDNPGIIYHTIGVNGAQFHHYSEARHFSAQTKALKPDLIIISLGTNEAYPLNFRQDKFYADMQLLFNQLRQENPNVGFLFTVPACSYRRKKPNPRLPLAAKTIIRFTTDNNLSYWNLQGVTGGDKSAYNWKKSHLLRPDGVHYSRVGYELQGKLFCIAFLNAYNAYVANRPE